MPNWHIYCWRHFAAKAKKQLKQSGLISCELNQLSVCRSVRGRSAIVLVRQL
jgi:hypothetical protein